MQRIAITVRPSSGTASVKGRSPFSWLLARGGAGPGKSLAQHDTRVSPVEELLEQTQAHIAEHDAWLQACGRLLLVLKDPAARLVTKQMADARAAHRRLLVRMAISLRDSLQWTQSEGALPCPEAGNVALDARRGLEPVTELISRERELAQGSRQLATAYGDIAFGLDALLLRAMALDSEKHERALRFVQRLLASQVEPTAGENDAGDDKPQGGRVLADATELVREPVRAPRSIVPA